jgi:hypothetical protein
MNVDARYGMASTSVNVFASDPAWEDRDVSEPVRVLTTSSIPEAEVAKSRLEGEGIPVLLSGTEGPYRTGPVHVLVPAELETQARLILADRAGDPANDV